MITIYSDQELPNLIEKPSIFLAGPTPRSTSVASWRPEAISTLKDLGFDGVVLIPERRDWTEGFDYDTQIAWEHTAMDAASVVCFWIPRDLRDMPGFTTNVEFGFWIAKNPEAVVYGRPDDSPKNNYLDHLIGRTAGKNGFMATVHDNLAKTMESAMNLSKKAYLNRTFFTSDFHLGDDRFHLYGRRFKDDNDQSRTIIENHNRVVRKNDTVYILGDVIYNKADPKKYLPLLDQLNGKKVLIRGNHDRDISDLEFLEYFERVIPDGEGMELRIGDIDCWLTHYPDTGRTDLFNLVGHVHGLWKVQTNCLNVGTDCHLFHPISGREVEFYFNAICQFYDKDVFSAYSIINAEYASSRGKKSSYTGELTSRSQ